MMQYSKSDDGMRLARAGLLVFGYDELLEVIPEAVEGTIFRQNLEQSDGDELVIGLVGEGVAIRFQEGVTCDKAGALVTLLKCVALTDRHHVIGGEHEDIALMGIVVGRLRAVHGALKFGHICNEVPLLKMRRRVNSLLVEENYCLDGQP